MDTYLTNNTPRPGDGAFLLQQGNARRGRRRGEKKTQTFLLENPKNDQDDQLRQENSAQLLSFLQPQNQQTQISTSLHPRDEPRTIADEMLLSRHHEAWGPVPSPAPLASTPSSFTTSLHTPISPSPVASCTTEPQTVHDNDNEMAVPPHRRPKKAPAPLEQSINNTTSQPASFVQQSSGSDDIRSKLATDFGVKVSEPTQASSTSKAPPSSHGHGEAYILATSECDKGRRSPVDSARAPVHQAPSGAEHRVRQSNSRGRGGARGRGATNNRSTKWPAPAETRPDPNRWDITWQSDAGSIPSDAADGGWGESRKRAPANEGGFKLTDFNGGWAPAPLNWDARPDFRDPAKKGQIERWCDDIEEQLCGKTKGITLNDVTGPDGTVYSFSPDKTDGKIMIGDYAPRYWIPIVIGRQAPKSFWNELLISSAPDPVHAGDLDNATPWWDLYQIRGGECLFLKAYDAPLIKGINPKEESSAERLARENDEGSARHTENKKRTERLKLEAKQENRRKAQERVQKLNHKPESLQNRLKPGLNMYVRSARPDDMGQVRDIYNHYVDFSCCTPETERRTTGDMLQRHGDVLGNRLPFLVACERGVKIPNRRKKRNPDDEDLVLPDRVVGFAFADDYNDIMGMYRFTAEIEVYTHKEHYMKGVAKCLLDKLTALLDPDYVERGGFDIQGDELEGVGPSRVIQNIIVNLPYDKPERLEWIGRWLSNWLGFKQVGNLEDVGNKGGKSVNLAIFQKRTGAQIDPANPPIMMRYPSS